MYTVYDNSLLVMSRLITSSFYIELDTKIGITETKVLSTLPLTDEGRFIVSHRYFKMCSSKNPQKMFCVAGDVANITGANVGGSAE